MNPAQRPPRLLIASTSEALTYARALKRMLGPSADATVWDEGLFAPGEFSLESLEEHSREYDGALVIATADDRVISRGRESKAPRDNIVFEFGLFVAVFGRRRALLLVASREDLKVPTDIAGLTYLPFKARRRPAESLKPVVETLKSRLTTWRGSLLDEDLQSRVDGLLKLSLDDVRETSQITSELGLHVFLVDEQLDPPQLVRVARVRSSPYSPKVRTFKLAEGIVGTCWQREEPVFASFLEDHLAKATQAQWVKLDAEARCGMDWDLLQNSRARYKAVGAVPITKVRREAPFVGCVAYNLGRGSTAHPSDLTSARVRRVLNHCAETMAIVL
jgi:hypothetical protein